MTVRGTHKSGDRLQTSKRLAAFAAKMVAHFDAEILANDRGQAMADRGLLSARLRAPRKSRRGPQPGDPNDRPLLRRELLAFLKLMEAERRRLRQTRTKWLRPRGKAPATPRDTRDARGTVTAKRKRKPTSR